jgi:Transposase
VIFVGVDWAEAHHEVCVLDQAGAVLGRRRVAHGVAGVAQLHGLVADHAAEPSEVVIGVELDRGLLVAALAAAGYQVVAVNPLAASRYRERHGTSGAKSDRGDAKMLADLVRTDRHNHRPLAGDSELAEAVRVLARAHQSAIWSRQRQLNSLRSALRAFYPAALDAFGTELATGEALAVLALAPPPSWAASCRGPRSPRPCGVAAANATSTTGRRRSRPRWVPPAGRGPTDQPRLRRRGRRDRRSPGRPQPADRDLGGGAGRGVQHAPGRQDHPLPARTRSLTGNSVLLGRVVRRWRRR